MEPKEQIKSLMKIIIDTASLADEIANQNGIQFETYFPLDCGCCANEVIGELEE